MLSLIEPPPSGFSILPQAASKLLSEKSWHKLRRSEDIDGTPSSTAGAASRQPAQLRRRWHVPVDRRSEPSGTLLVLGAAAIVALRRKRHPR